MTRHHSDLEGGGVHLSSQSSVVLEHRQVPNPPPCQRCADAWEYAPASVRFAGELVCGFHAYGAWYDKPARHYKRDWP